MCPLRLIPRILLFNEEDLVPEMRTQRVLNKGRIPEIARYILDNRGTYTFSALTASIDGEVRFVPYGDVGEAHKLGSLHVPMDARFVINDGQHRRAAIETAIRENPELADESIAIVFFLDIGLGRCQQMFADLNRHAIRPSTSLGVLYDHRDDEAKIVRDTLLKIPLFRDLTELERSTLSARSRKLFTLSALYSATRALLLRMEDRSLDKRAALAAAFWEETAKQFPEWEQVWQQKVSAAEIRRDMLHPHGVVLQALGRAGNALLHDQPGDWRRTLPLLGGLDWSRASVKTWEGRALMGGRVSKSTMNVTLTANLLKRQLGLRLTPDEQRIESAHLRGDNAAN
jgi:DNA sulfur modification protein DndB